VKLPRYRTGDAALDAEIAEIVERIADPANADLVFELVASAMRLAGRSRRPWRSQARQRVTPGDAPRVPRVRAVPRRRASSRCSALPVRSPTTLSTSRHATSRPRWRRATGWSSPARAPASWRRASKVQAPRNAFGVAIKLPFEAATSQFIDGDPKLVNFRYFFTRKLEFIKESDAFVLLPGGFGTLDEAFELLTLCRQARRSPRPSCSSTFPAAPTGSRGASS
jgi:hypothetical protein